MSAAVGTLADLLAVRDVHVHYGGVRAVDGVSLTLEHGKLYGLIGPNGSGKSTLLAAMSRMTHLTQGSLTLRGQHYEHLGVDRVAQLGMRRTFQTVRLARHLHVLENIMAGADSGFVRRGFFACWLLPWRSQRHEKISRSRATAAMERLGLIGLEDANVLDLPYGTQRRVEIARAVASDVEILLMDEPTAGMTRSERDEIGRLLMQLRDDGLTILLVEHDVPLISSVCDHVFVLNLGKLIAEGDPDEVVNRPEVQRAYLGEQ